MISNAVLLSALAACALAAPSKSPNLSKRSGPTDLWKVPAARDPNDPKHLLWKQINLVYETIDTAADDGRLYSYYPATGNAGGQAYVFFSASPKDLDGMGQDVRVSFRTENGWSKPQVAFPPALLPNQTTIETSEYYCSQGIAQRALQPLGIVYAGGGESSPKWYAVAQSSDNICPGAYQSAGRLARLLNLSDPSKSVFDGEPCWIETNDYTGGHQWAETVYGTKYRMSVCKDKDAINAALANPRNVPSQATSLFNTPLVAADGKHNVSYPTNAVWIEGASGAGQYMRLWSDVSKKNSTASMFVEYTSDSTGADWFPAKDDGSKIQQSTIRSSWKSWFGASEQFRVFISNSEWDAASSQNILSLATSRGSDLAFTNVGVVRGGNANKTVPKGTRPTDNTDLPGFYWPSAVFSGAQLLVAYSENKAAIGLATIDFANLP